MKSENQRRHFSLHLLILSTAMPAKWKLMQKSRNPEKSIIKFIGDVSKMQCTGFACPQHGGLESFLTTCRRLHQPRPPGDISRADLSGLGTWVPCPWPRIVVATVGGGSKSLERNLPNSTNALTLCPSGTTQQNCVGVTRES